VIRYGPSWLPSMARSLVPVPVGQVARFLTVEAQAQRAGRAVPHGPDKLVEAAAARRDEGSAPVRNAVGTRSVHRPECWQMPRLSKIVTCCPG